MALCGTADSDAMRTDDLLLVGVELHGLRPRAQGQALDLPQGLRRRRSPELLRRRRPCEQTLQLLVVELHFNLLICQFLSVVHFLFLFVSFLHV